MVVATHPEVSALNRNLWKSGAFILILVMSFGLLYSAASPAKAAVAWTKVWNASNDLTTEGMAVYNNKLYAIGDYWASVWCDEGSHWARINSLGFGDYGNESALSLTTFNDLLYVGTYNGNTGAEVWAYNGSTWTQVNQDAFGDFGENLITCQALTTYNNQLYAVISSNGGKFQVYRYSGSGTSWTRVDTGSWDGNNQNGLCATSFGGYLWVGTENDTTGAEVWRWNGSTWSQVNTDGFGTSDDGCFSFCSYNSSLYASTGNSPTRGKVYRYNSGNSWTKVSSNGLGSNYNYAVLSLASYKGMLFAGTRQLDSGCEIWSYNGSSWTQENTNGFGDSSNTDVTAMTVFSNRLYVGTENYAKSAQVWTTNGAPAPYDVYLAEGSTLWLANCSCYISVENPNTTAVTVKLTYMTPSGAKAGPTVAMPAKSQATVNPADTLGKADFSTKVECLEGKTISADRTMVWNAGSGEEGHCSTAVTSPATSWYLPEGSSAWGFECWLLIQNPNGTTANCSVIYMKDGEGPQTVNHTVPANSRASFSMSADIGSKDASIKVTSNVPVIPERAMYRNNRREGHDSIGTTTPANDYYLAEGATGYNVGYITYVLVQNPQNSPNNVTLTYMTQNGQVAGPSFTMSPNSRKTIRVNDQLSPNTDVSTHVHGSQPIIAERAMYWNNGTGEACHDSIGMDQPHTTFYLPDGETSNGRETWTLVQNPNSSPVTVEISYLTANGQGDVVKTESIPANSRKTFNMLSHSGINGRAAIEVTCKTAGKKVMVERAMYWNGRGAGTDTIGGFGD